MSEDAEGAPLYKGRDAPGFGAISLEELGDSGQILSAEDFVQSKLARVIEHTSDATAKNTGNLLKSLECGHVHISFSNFLYEHEILCEDYLGSERNERYNRCYDECITKGFTSEEASLLAHIHSIEPKNIKVKKGSIRDTMMGLKVLYYNISKTGEGKTLCVDIVEPNGRTDKGSTFGILDS